MELCLRADDLGWTPHREDKRDAGLALARRFHAAMQGLPFLAAVIPAMLDKDGSAWLESGPAGMRVAMHGWDHAPVEFRGLTVDECRQRVCQAKTALGSVPIRDIVLPFNQYEHGLAEACHAEGIEFLWGGGRHTHTDPSSWPSPPEPYPLENVCFVPSWARTYAATWWRMSDVTDALAKTLPPLLELPGKAVLTLHVTWESSFSQDFDGVKWLVDAVGDHLISADKYLNGN